MPNSLSINASISFTHSTLPIYLPLAVANLAAAIATEQVIRTEQLIPTSGNTAINLGGITAINWVMFVNRDTTNYVDVYTAVSSGKLFAHLLPGYLCLLPLGSDAQAPAAIAHTASCWLDLFIASL